MLPSTQFQIGHTPRCAARDYKETHHHWSIIRQREITGNAKELNDWAIENEEFFIHRFGFDTPMEQRRDIFELKVHLDLTDREIARLKTAGALTVGKGKTTCLCVDRALAAFGAVSLSIGLIASTLLGSALLLAGLPPIKQLFGLTLISGFFIPFIWAASAISIQPILILNSRGIRLGQRWYLPLHITDERRNAA